MNRPGRWPGVAGSPSRRSGRGAAGTASTTAATRRTACRRRDPGARQAVAVALRTALLLPPDGLLAVVRGFPNPEVSRSGPGRCRRRHGVGNLQALEPREPKPAHGPFRACAPGCLHIDVKCRPRMAGKDRRRHLFAAIDRATRRVGVAHRSGTDRRQRAALASRDLERAAPVRITRVLADRATGTPSVRAAAARGRAFTDRLFGLGKRSPAGQHEFDRLCPDPGTEPRPAPPMRPQTNVMVGRLDGRIEDVLRSRRFHGGEDLEETLPRHVHLHDSQLPPSAPKGRTPVGTPRDWQSQWPDLFRKRVCDHAGRDIKTKSGRNPFFVRALGWTGVGADDPR